MSSVKNVTVFPSIFLNKCSYVYPKLMTQFQSQLKAFGLKNVLYLNETEDEIAQKYFQSGKKDKNGRKAIRTCLENKKKSKEKILCPIDRQNHDPLTILDLRVTLDKALKSKEVTYCACASTVHKQWNHTKLI